MKKPLYKQLFFIKSNLDGVGFTIGVRRFGISMYFENKPRYFIGRRDRNYHNRYFNINLWRFFVSIRWNKRQPINYTYINGNYYEWEIDKGNHIVKVVPAIPGKEKLYYD